MKERIVSNMEIAELSNRQESHFYDNKAFVIKGGKIQKIAVAFANADGGEFIIGIRDKKEEVDFLKGWQGIENIESFNFVFQNLTQLSPTIPHNYKFLKDEKGRFALRITIEKSESVHKTANNTVYVRKISPVSSFKRPR
ncbi:ATP-binding protein [Muricauda ruestringensis]|uniref:ATP-binding protein n=1 Tax=Flagellimonas aurea TaxID=2915619 RepID=A0ABS3GAS0_9FLAO|nr:ATP-binding protein [Allomuricauda aurea]MBO0355677.1 ATP-binding protein [Allomuricauda aurea]|tara:strand:+ start:1931 stop:2350 length:420 start_codon:yes stop_codon:yes gene_type:complete